MNKKDCENLGYILSTAQCPGGIDWDYLFSNIFEMDDRIEAEYKDFQAAQGINEEVDNRAAELMVAANGKDWAIRRKNLLVKTYGECLEEARKEVYGEDYYPGMFK